MFDVYLQLGVTLNWKAGLPQTDAVVYVRLIGDLSGLSSPQGDSWRVVGRLDRRLAHIGAGPYRWRAEKTVQSYTIYLQTAHGQPWAKLLDFPEMPNRNSWGKGFASDVRIPEHAIIPTNLQWGVRTNAPQPHLDDPLEHMTIWSRMLRPSGWKYDSSGGSSIVGLVGVGGSHAKGYLNFKRGGATCRVDYQMVGAGVGLHGAGWSDSSAFESWGTDVYCSSRIVGQMKAADFEGGIMALDLGGGGGAGGPSGSGDFYVVMFTDKVPTSLVVANPLSWKAAFSCWGPSAGMGTPGPSAQLMAYSGMASLHSAQSAAP
jgi:hypothetical protein